MNRIAGSPEVRVRVAGVELSLTTPGSGLVEVVRRLLRHHVTPGIDPAAVCLHLVEGEFGEARKPVPLQAGLVPAAARPTLVWGVPAAIGEWLDDHVYYRVLFPILADALARCGRLRLHAALLWDDEIGSVLALGDRGAGKSSLSAAWLQSGAKLATDDTVLVSCDGGRLALTGLHRDLHVDPALIPELGLLTGLKECQEYLPRSNRLSYDWVAARPRQRLEQAAEPVTVVVSSVEPQGRTTSVLLTRREARIALDRAAAGEAENQLLDDVTRSTVLARLKEQKVWKVTWGPDVWGRPGGHRGLLQEIVAADGRRRADD